MEAGIMTATFYQVLLFLVPAIVSGICAALLFQVIDRLHLFYRGNYGLNRSDADEMSHRRAAG